MVNYRIIECEECNFTVILDLIDPENGKIYSGKCSKCKNKYAVIKEGRWSNETELTIVKWR